MTPTTLPWIRDDDFLRLQQIIPELGRMTYAEWQGDHEKTMNDPRNGSIRMPVTPGGFAEWLERTGQSPRLELLWVYAAAVAGPSRAESGPGGHTKSSTL